MDHGAIMPLTEEQIQRLQNEAENFDHYHPSDRQPTLDTLRALQSLEVVVTVTSALDMSTDTDSRKRNADIVRVDTTGGPVTVTLPFALSSGRRVTVTRVAGANNVTVASQAAETVNGAASVAISSSFTPRTFKDMSATTWEDV